MRFAPVADASGAGWALLAAVGSDSGWTLPRSRSVKARVGAGWLLLEEPVPYRAPVEPSWPWPFPLPSEPFVAPFPFPRIKGGSPAAARLLLYFSNFLGLVPGAYFRRPPWAYVKVAGSAAASSSGVRACFFTGGCQYPAGSSGSASLMAATFLITLTLCLAARILALACRFKRRCPSP